MKSGATTGSSTDRNPDKKEADGKSSSNKNRCLLPRLYTLAYSTTINGRLTER
jgi:hypothetical protein